MRMALTPTLDHHAILGAMLAPALLMAATGSLLVSANARLARVVDRLRTLIVAWEQDAPDRAERDTQIARHRHRAALVLRACWMLYAALGWRPMRCWVSDWAQCPRCWRSSACCVCWPRVLRWAAKSACR
jgi:Protein of unknown function (DUF2721)